MNLVEKTYLLTQVFPREEIYGLTSQIRRAVVSVPSNIAEGHTRNHLRSTYITFDLAGSLAELETQMEIAGRLKYIFPVNEGGVGRGQFAGKATVALRIPSRTHKARH